MPAVQRAGRRLRPREPEHAAPSATATSTSSTARRSGRRSPQDAKFGILIARTDVDVPKHRGISYFIIPMDLARHRGAADPQHDRRRRCSTRCSSPTCACRPRTSSARRTSAGAWRRPRSRTSGCHSRPAAVCSGATARARATSSSWCAAHGGSATRSMRQRLVERVHRRRDPALPPHADDLGRGEQEARARRVAAQGARRPARQAGVQPGQGPDGRARDARRRPRARRPSGSRGSTASCSAPRSPSAAARARCSATSSASACSACPHDIDVEQGKTFAETGGNVAAVWLTRSVHGRDFVAEQMRVPDESAEGKIMKFWASTAFTPPEHHLPLARAADEAGIDGIVMSDHIFFPQQLASPYPYSPYRTAADLGARHAVARLWVTIGAMAARHRAAAVRDEHLHRRRRATCSRWPSRWARRGAVGRPGAPRRRGRVDARRSSTQTGQEFDNRGKRLDEMIAALRALWSGGWVEYHGEHYDFGPLMIEPAPDAAVPIWCGGHSKPALRRAARHCDGWIGNAYSVEDSEHYVGRLQQQRQEAGPPSCRSRSTRRAGAADARRVRADGEDRRDRDDDASRGCRRTRSTTRTSPTSSGVPTSSARSRRRSRSQSG